MKAKKSIKYWAEDDKPREKILQKGTQALSDVELLAILLSSGSANQSAIELSRTILADVSNNLNLLGKKSAKDLMKYQGVGIAKASTILAALELGRRRKQEEALEQKFIKSSQDAFDYFQPILGDLSHEEFHILLLNRANGIIASKMISIGGTAGTIIDVKLIMKYLLEHLTQSIIIAHNHPSGNNNPSQQDIAISIKIKKACEFFDIKFLDHIIIADKTFYSLADEGKI
ncbi:MAG: DNA repair protein RadC [Bacteroidales bacterium]|jgi:DNA repair protein RadC|nr:DNA repair protein RadC [Bacteroidales bacterium]MCK9498116.1 DNA repair protein RadC [Bacteroidales bacterium]MDY0313682.1 DNA repair protein RadC [Bacteroidales bacterium]NLB87527.1 DNA repair protein RadC [Bacteroidales bacterium]